ncbi:DeoR/GlpR family DNA-binding transcription regulator [Williamsia sp. CHRR-6]|uniref:DeoR/GlpR family DNA-binding transcription regulator n=1 Tax=Williamsia sp. CHRR-6 TaxID=2835871 RepID=UPI001BDB2655|nr:DeoR/GlpR family DNA-binding transcription regulator [Williamsia sp. CHRR-6]MBT0567063.1 DeoR/GlpR transcriptional regulator [Williamsia sp. CHRR-6]
MLAHQRHQAILDAVSVTGTVRVVDLVAQLGVSDMTIRRDITELAQRGLVERVHGGVTMPGTASVHEPGFTAKSTMESEAKRAIAVAAAELVRPGTSIGISAGTTTHALARLLAPVADLTVITNSVPVADTLYENGRSDQTVLLTGGQRTRSFALVGPIAVNTITSLHLDMLFLGTHGFDVESGLTSPNLMEAQTNLALIRAARRVVVLADHTKWGVTALSSIIPLREVDVLITDVGIGAAARDELSAHIDEVILARPSTSSVVSG